MHRVLHVTGFIFAAVLLLSASSLAYAGSMKPVAADSQTRSITLAQSGLILDDPLNTTHSQNQLQSQTSGNWSFQGHYGSYHINYMDQSWQYAANGSNYNANVSFSEAATGLNISVKAVANGAYTGFYAVSSPSNAELFHARITSVYSSIPGGFLQVGLYVRASSGDTNYIACASVSSSAGTRWEIIHGTGNSVEATNFSYLWIDNATSQPTSEDCTVVTNGNNYLAVYMNGDLMYENSGLALGIVKPVDAYLGVESSYSPQSFWGSWSDFYSTQTGSVETINLPATAANMSIVGQNGTILGSVEPVNGSAVVNIASYDFPLQAYIKVYNSNGSEIASTAGPVGLDGGDIYTAKTTIQQQMGAVVGFLSAPNFFYILIPAVFAILATSMVLTYSRHRRTNR